MRVQAEISGPDLLEIVSEVGPCHGCHVVGGGANTEVLQCQY